MKLTLFGATGALGSECLNQALAAGHDITVLVRSAAKLPAELAGKITIIEGDALNRHDVASALPAGTEAILFAIGVDKQSPKNLCTDVTRHILELMANSPIKRFVWCGGGSTFVAEDTITFGARFVRKFSEWFLALRHYDKEEQYQLLLQHPTINWYGVRPLQMRKGEHTGNYRLGFNRFSGASKISFSDCAHAMIGMLADDTWLHKAPIVQY